MCPAVFREAVISQTQFATTGALGPNDMRLPHGRAHVCLYHERFLSTPIRQILHQRISTKKENRLTGINSLVLGNREAKY